MRSVKVSIGLLITVFVSMVRASSTAEVFIHATFTNPPCNIQVPVTYYLGLLNRGETKIHSPFHISWECGTTPVTTMLTASVVSGKLQGQNQVEMITVNQQQDSGSFLKLKEKTAGLLKDINITGQKVDAFCNTISSSVGQCELVPETEVKSSAIAGQVYATLLFTVNHQ